MYSSTTEIWSAQPTVADQTASFVTFSAVWSLASVKFYVSHTLVATTSAATPIATPAFFLLDMQWNCFGHGSCNEATDGPASLQYDWVRMTRDSCGGVCP
jgi:hypothetical protein